MMTKKAIEFIEHEEYGKANELSFKLLERDKIDEFLEINDMLLKRKYTPALLIKAYYHLIIGVYEYDGNYGEKYLNKYLKKRPDSTSAQYQKSLTEMAKGNKKKSLKTLENLIDNYSESPYDDELLQCPPRQELCESKLLCLYEFKPDESWDYAEQVLKEYPDNAKAMVIKAKLLIEEDKNQEALTIINESLKKERTIDGILVKGDIYNNLKEYEDAVACFTIGIAAFDETEKHHAIKWNHKKALALIQIKKYKSAMKCLNEAIDTIRELEVILDLNEDGIELLKECEAEKEKLLKKGVADVKYHTHKIHTGKSIIVLLVLDILLYFTLGNIIINLIITALLLIMVIISLIRTLAKRHYMASK